MQGHGLGRVFQPADRGQLLCLAEGVRGIVMGDRRTAHPLRIPRLDRVQ